MNLSVRAIFTAFRKSIWKDWPATSLPLRKAKNQSAYASAILMKNLDDPIVDEAGLAEYLSPRDLCHLVDCALKVKLVEPFLCW